MKLTAWFVTSLLSSAAAQAEVPVFVDNELHLDAVATMDESGNHYYRDVILHRDADGRFRVASAASRPLVSVRSVEANLFAATGIDTKVQASVTVTGLTSVACVVLEKPASTRVDKTFHVLLAETVMEPGAVCASLVANQPFELSLPLDIAQLPAGTYTVDVNGVTDTFTLENAAR
jgi:hypothetical protein